MATGTVKKNFRVANGYGFIKPDDNSGDIYFNTKDRDNRYVPQPGEQVSFDIKTGKKGPYATNLIPQSYNWGFINPYNFVRSDGAVKEGRPISHHQFVDPDGGKEIHSGRIVCNLQVETPLFIPDSETITYKIEVQVPNDWQWSGNRMEVFFSQNERDEIVNLCKWEERTETPSLPEHLSHADLDDIKPRVIEGQGILVKGTGGQHDYLETSLPIRNAHKVMKFFRLHDQPAIPPTSLKGMIRSVLEAASNSCFSILQGEKLGIRRRPEWYDSPDTLLAGRILEIPSMPGTKGKVKKMAAYKIPHKDNKQYKNREDFNGKEVYIKIVDKQVEVLESNEGQDTKIGYLKTSSKGIGRDGKKYERVFIDPDKLENEELPDGFEREPKAFNLPYEICESYRVVNKNNKFEYTKRLKVEDVVWFRATDENEVKEIGFTQIYRLPFSSAVRDLLHSSLYPCESIDNLCPACHIFGRVVDKPATDGGTNALAGKVSFSLGKLVSGDTSCQDDVPLKILSSPKPTFYNFYVIDLDNSNQVRDYDGRLVIDRGGNVDRTKNISSVALRGRKFYWHYPNACTKQEIYTREGRTQDSQNSTVELLTEGVFKFSVDFHNLTDYELGLLLYSLELEGAESQLRHKLGMGKPLGLGSVKITVDKLDLIDRKERYRSILADGILNEQEYREKFILKGFKKVQASEESDEESNIRNAFDNLPYIQDLKVMLDFKDFHELEVKYPRARNRRDGEPRGFEWFQQNKKKPLPTAQEVNSNDQTRILDDWS